MVIVGRNSLRELPLVSVIVITVRRQPARARRESESDKEGVWKRVEGEIESDEDGVWNKGRTRPFNACLLPECSHTAPCSLSCFF